MKKRKFSEKEKQARSEGMLKWWREHPEEKKKRIKKMREGSVNYWANPENMKKRSKRFKQLYKRRKKKPSDYVKIHPDLVKEIKEQYMAGCGRNEISRLLGINIITIRKYLKE